MCSPRVLSLLFILCVLADCSVLIPPPKYISMYQVQRGDSLTAIAQRYGVDVDVIVDFNELDESKPLMIGAIIQIPEPQRGSEMRAGLKATNQRDQKSVRTIALSGAKKWIGNLEWPIRNAMMTSKFGQRYSRFHEGLDLAAKKGTPIFAAHEGEVAYSGSGLNGYGKMIIIKGSGIVTVYAHNSRNSVDVGDSVRAGEKIAEVGATGDATGPHVHYEIRIQDADGRHVAVDPMAFYRAN